MTGRPERFAHVVVGEYALVTAAVATLAISIATIPEGELAARLPTTAAKSQALVAKDARARGLPAARAKAALARAPYPKAALRYLYASGWLDARRDLTSCIFAKASPSGTATRVAAAVRRNPTLVRRLARMEVTVAQAATAVVRGASSAC
ncbi:MAG TPA: hypothetical protein VH305_05470 [Gaiella sp.]